MRCRRGCCLVTKCRAPDAEVEALFRPAVVRSVPSVLTLPALAAKRSRAARAPQDRCLSVVPLTGRSVDTRTVTAACGSHHSLNGTTEESMESDPSSGSAIRIRSRCIGLQARGRGVGSRRLLPQTGPYRFSTTDLQALIISPPSPLPRDTALAVSRICWALCAPRPAGGVMIKAGLHSASLCRRRRVGVTHRGNKQWPKIHQRVIQVQALPNTLGFSKKTIALGHPCGSCASYPC